MRSLTTATPRLKVVEPLPPLPGNLDIAANRFHIRDSAIKANTAPLWVVPCAAMSRDGDFPGAGAACSGTNDAIEDVNAEMRSFVAASLPPFPVRLMFPLPLVESIPLTTIPVKFPLVGVDCWLAEKFKSPLTVERLAHVDTTIFRDVVRLMLPLVAMALVGLGTLIWPLAKTVKLLSASNVSPLQKSGFPKD